MTNQQLIDEKTAKINELRKELDDLEEKEFVALQVPFMKSLVGKCFKDKYGGYRRIKGLVKDKKNGYYHWIVEGISLNSAGAASYGVFSDSAFENRAWWGKVPFSGHTQVTNLEFETKKAKYLAEMANPRKLIKFLTK